MRKRKSFSSGQCREGAAVSNIPQTRGVRGPAVGGVVTPFPPPATSPHPFNLPVSPPLRMRRGAVAVHRLHDRRGVGSEPR